MTQITREEIEWLTGGQTYMVRSHSTTIVSNRALDRLLAVAQHALSEPARIKAARREGEAAGIERAAQVATYRAEDLCRFTSAPGPGFENRADEASTIAAAIRALLQGQGGDDGN